MSAVDTPASAEPTRDQLIDNRVMRTIREFEERVHTEFATGEIPVVSDRLASIDVPLLIVWGAGPDHPGRARPAGAPSAPTCTCSTAAATRLTWRRPATSIG